MAEQKHSRHYREFWGYDQYDTIPSLVSGQPATDKHHLVARGMGGAKHRDGAWNIVALTREEHIKAESDSNYNDYLKRLHFMRIVEHTAKMLGIDYGKIDLSGIHKE